MGGDETGEGYEVPDGQYYGFRSSYLSEYGRPGPTTKLRPLHGHGVSARRLPEGSLILPWAQDMPPSFSARTSFEDTGEQYFAEFRRAVPKPDKQAGHHNFWISESTWRLVHDCVHVTLAI